MRWFSRLSSREQVLLLAMVFVAAGAGFFTLVWTPLSEAREAALRDIKRYDRIAAEVRAAGDDLQTETGTVRRNPATVVAETAAEFDLAIRRLEPEGERTRVVMAEAAFDRIISWLSVLEADHALSVTAIEMERRPESGVVTARITLEN